MEENELFERASVPKAFFTLTIPLVLGRIVGLVYNMVDTYFIAKTQDAALVAGAGLMALAAPRLIRFFLQDAAIVEKGSLMLRFMLAGAPFAGLLLVFITLFQATGKAMPTLALTLSRQGIIYAICIFALRAVFGFHGVICAQAVSDVLTTLLALVLFARSGIVV